MKMIIVKVIIFLITSLQFGWQALCREDICCLEFLSGLICNDVVDLTISSDISDCSVAGLFIFLINFPNCCDSIRMELLNQNCLIMWSFDLIWNSCISYSYQLVLISLFILSASELLLIKYRLFISFNFLFF